MVNLSASHEAAVEGVRQLSAGLDGAARRGGARVAFAGLKADAAALAAEMTRMAPRGRSGQTAGSVGWRFLRTGEKDTLAAKIGVGVGKKLYNRNGQALYVAPHAHLVALGTGERVRESGGSTGSMPGNDFVFRAWTWYRSLSQEQRWQRVHGELYAELGIVDG